MSVDVEEGDGSKGSCSLEGKAGEGHPGGMGRGGGAVKGSVKGEGAVGVNEDGAGGGRSEAVSEEEGGKEGDDFSLVVCEGAVIVVVGPKGWGGSRAEGDAEEGRGVGAVLGHGGHCPSTVGAGVVGGTVGEEVNGCEVGGIAARCELKRSPRVGVEGAPRRDGGEVERGGYSFKTEGDLANARDGH